MVDLDSALGRAVGMRAVGDVVVGVTDGAGAVVVDG